MGGQSNISETIQNLKEIVNCYDSEIYSMLVECHMDPNETAERLISQDPFQEVKSKRGNNKKDTKDQAESSRRRITNHGARNSGKGYYNTAGSGGNKFNSNETRLPASVPANKRGNHWAGSSSPNSDPKNAELKKAAPTVSTGAASSSSLPAPAYQSAWANANPGKKTMAEIVKMGKPLHQKKFFVPPRSSETQESGSKAPLKDEGSSAEKQDVSGPVSSLLKPASEPKPHAEDQVSEPQHVDESQMDDEVPEIKTNPVASHPDVDQLVAPFSHLRFGTFGLGIGSGQATSGFNDNLEVTQETGGDSSLRNLENNFYGEEEEQQLRDNATDEQEYYHIDLTARNEPPQDPQMQSSESLFSNVMGLRGAGQHAAALNQHLALNAYYHQRGMPLRNHGDFTSDPFMPHGYMHSGLQQGLPVGNHQAPQVVVLPPSAPSLQHQNENTRLWHQVNRPFLHAAPGGGVYIFSAHTSHYPPSFVQAQQLYQQQLSQQAAMDQLHQHQHHHHQHHHYHHQQSGGEASSWTREQLWPNNN